MSNKNCKPSSTQVIGPILEGDEVIIGVVNPDGSLGYLGAKEEEAPLFGTAFISQDSTKAILDRDNTMLLDSIPRFQINFLANDPSYPSFNDPSGNNNPLVFFTLTNGEEVRSRCSNCKGLIPVQKVLEAPGLSVTNYRTCRQFDPLGSSERLCVDNKATKSNRYLSPGAPVPIQLIAVNGERSWFPLTLPENLPPSDPNAHFVLALSNIPYRMNAFIGGRCFTNIAVAEEFFPLTTQSGETNPNYGVFLSTEKPQEYYIIPTKYFTSNLGVSMGGGCADCAANKDGGLGALCSIGCRLPQSSNSEGKYCCSGTCRSSDGLDCTKVCKYGFTQEDDCKDRCFYNYCKITEAPCNGDCKSTCPTVTAFDLVEGVCTLGPNGYFCESRTGTIGPDNKGLTTTEIVAIIIIAAFIAAIIIYVLYAWGSAYNADPD